MADEPIKGCSQFHESAGGTNLNHSRGTISHLWDDTVERGDGDSKALLMRMKTQNHFEKLDKFA